MTRGDRALILLADGASALLITACVGLAITALWSCPGAHGADRPPGEYPPPEQFEVESDYWLIASWPRPGHRYRLWVHPAPAPGTEVTLMLCDGDECTRAPVPSALAAWIGWQLVNVVHQGDLACEKYCPP